MSILITGGVGFIGSNFAKYLAGQHPADLIVFLDKFTYAENRSNLPEQTDKFRVEKGDISDMETVLALLKQYQIQNVFHFAAESHVDRSIHVPEAFWKTNATGILRLLTDCKAWYQEGCPHFRLLHVSADEVYGSLDIGDPGFTEDSQYAPNSPYSAIKSISKLANDLWRRPGFACKNCERSTRT